PNNLAILDKEEFFVSNDAYFKNSFLKNLEFLLPIFKFGSIVYYNKGKARNADSFLFMPNGLSVDKQKRHLFVGSIITKQLWIYNIDNDRNIVRTKSIDVGAMIDNVFFDDNKNTVWLGCHPVSHLLAAHLGHPKTVSAPSLILAVEFTDKQMNNYTIKDYYADDGKELWASTVAVPYQNQLLIGTITDRLMLCDMPGYQNTPHLA
uniref:Arylesterase n=1 Tax=Romanomermis culicivorax TaxID=13658 RepID=A0A915JR34_ROMCU